MNDQTKRLREWVAGRKQNFGCHLVVDTDILAVCAALEDAERELATVRAELACYVKNLADAQGDIAEEVKANELLRAVRDAMRAALVRLRDCDWTISLPDRMDAVREIAREALNQTKGE